MFSVSARTSGWVAIGISNDELMVSITLGKVMRSVNAKFIIVFTHILMLQPNTDIVVGATDGMEFFVDDRFVCIYSYMKVKILYICPYCFVVLVTLHFSSLILSFQAMNVCIEFPFFIFSVKRYAFMRVQPPVDSSQDIMNAVATLENGFTTVTFTRPRSSSDPNDIPLDQCRYLLYAYGSTVNVATRNISYHGTARGILENSFCLPPPDVCPVGMHNVPSLWLTHIYK